jgi:thiamine biosynthesis lipoprotein
VTILQAAGRRRGRDKSTGRGRLSLYRPSTEIAAVNQRAAHEPVRVSPDTFRLLQRAAELHRETEGAFDITIAPLVRAWGFMGGDGHLPDRDQLAAARACVGMHLVTLDPARFTVRFQRPGVMLDLGAIGKGYAVDRAAETLRELGVQSALIHGGTSTVFAMGRPSDAPSWKIAVEAPRQSAASPAALLAQIELHDESLSTSAVWGKAFVDGGKTFGHVIDPRSGQPVQAAFLATLVAATATASDALSTALLTLGPDGIETMARTRPTLRALVVMASEGGPAYRVASQGITVCSGASPE